MTLKKALFIKGFILVDKINRLLLYQCFKALFFKKTSLRCNEKPFMGNYTLHVQFKVFFSLGLR